MDSAFTKNFGYMDTYGADADSAWSGSSGHESKMKEKGQVGIVNPDHLDF